MFIALDPGVQLQHGAAAGPGSGLQEPGQPHQQAGQAGRHEVLQSAGGLCLLSLFYTQLQLCRADSDSSDSESASAPLLDNTAEL